MKTLSSRSITRAVLVAVVVLFGGTLAAIVLEQWRLAGVVASIGAVGLAVLVWQVGRHIHRAVSPQSSKRADAEREVRAVLGALKTGIERAHSDILELSGSIATAIEPLAKDVRAHHVVVESMPRVMATQNAAVSAQIVTLERALAAAIAAESVAAADRIAALGTQVAIVKDKTNESREIVGRLAKSQERRDARLHGAVLTDVQALLQLQARFAPKAPLPIAGGWAIRPTGIMWLVDLIANNAPRNVVECGSGTSTLWMALALRQQGSGKIVAFEHQEAFAAETRGTLARHGLNDVADVLEAELVDVKTPLGMRPWYDIGGHIAGAIDLVVVDGPPEATGLLARYPALPLLAPYLADGALIVVDDAQRPDEQEMCERWLSEYPMLERIAQAAEDVHVYRWNTSSA
jgi:predicted O-methyltransferase YrrM